MRQKPEVVKGSQEKLEAPDATQAAGDGSTEVTETMSGQSIDVRIGNENKMEFYEERKEKSMTKVMTIEGMMCGHCTGRVQKALEAVEVLGILISSENVYTSFVA